MDEYLSKAILMYPNAKCELNYNNNFEFLVAVILSAQTTDKAVNKITPILFSKYPTFNSIDESCLDDIYSIIKPLGLAKNKSKSIVKLAIQLKEIGCIPTNLSDLEKLSGVGHKTACVYLAEIYKEEHIAVDTHVLRVANRLGLSNSNNPIQVQRDLEARYERSEYIKAHHTFLFLGRYTCKSINPKCENCLLNNICLYKK
jgi:endonuclease III